MKKKESKLVRQTNDNDYNERIYDSPAFCQDCCCRSCTGFNCPWINNNLKYLSNGNQFLPWRCYVCQDHRFTKIFDCHFYTYYRRQKFFVKRRFVRKKTKIDILDEKVSKILKILEKMGEM